VCEFTNHIYCVNISASSINRIAGESCYDIQYYKAHISCNSNIIPYSTHRQYPEKLCNSGSQKECRYWHISKHSWVGNWHVQMYYSSYCGSNSSSNEQVLVITKWGLLLLSDIIIVFYIVFCHFLIIVIIVLILSARYKLDIPKIILAVRRTTRC